MHVYVNVRAYMCMHVHVSTCMHLRVNVRVSIDLELRSSRATRLLGTLLPIVRLAVMTGITHDLVHPMFLRTRTTHPAWFLARGDQTVLLSVGFAGATAGRVTHYCL